MKKSTIVPLIVFIVLAGGLYYVLSSFQINLFTGKVQQFDNFTLENTVKEVPYSLGDVVGGNASLKGSDWGIVLGTIVGFPMIVALLVRFRLKRKERKRLAAIHANNAANETVA